MRPFAFKVKPTPQPELPVSVVAVNTREGVWETAPHAPPVVAEICYGNVRVAGIHADGSISPATDLDEDDQEVLIQYGVALTPRESIIVRDYDDRPVDQDL